LYILRGADRGYLANLARRRRAARQIPSPLFAQFVWIVGGRLLALSLSSVCVCECERARNDKSESNSAITASEGERRESVEQLGPRLSLLRRGSAVSAAKSR